MSNQEIIEAAIAAYDNAYPTVAHHEAMHIAVDIALKASEQKAREVLAEVKTWIDNWSPPMIYDPEWADTARKIEEALGEH